MLRLLGVCALAVSAYGADLTGSWSGNIEVGGNSRPVYFEFASVNGALTGSFGMRPEFQMPLHAVTLEGDRLHFEAGLMGPVGKFEGLVLADRITGVLKAEGEAPPIKVDIQRRGGLLAFPSPGTPAELKGLTDEFKSPDSLKNWKKFSEVEALPDRINRAAIGLDGILTVIPKSGAWYSGYHGVFYFKEVSGDFTISTRLKVSGVMLDEPQMIWSISGLMLRVPGDLRTPADQRKENWLYLMTGRGPGASRVIDAKSTRDSSNLWDVTPAQPGWHELKIARIGPLFLMLARPDGGQWVLRKRIYREDLPAALQAGFNLTSDFKFSAGLPAWRYNSEAFPESAPDNSTQFDYVRFERAPSTEALRGRPLLTIPDAEILALFK